MTAGPRATRLLEITSTKSARVSAVRRLHERKHRQLDGAFVVEGPTNVAAALQSPSAHVDSVYFTTRFAEAQPAVMQAIEARTSRGIGESGALAEVVSVTDEVLDAMSETRQPQGVLAVCGHVARGCEVLQRSGHAWPAGLPHTGTWVVLDQANDPGNAGSVIRTAEACGVSAVLLTEGSVDPHNGKCVRATAGAIFRVPIVTGVTWEQVRAAAAGRPIVATAASGECLLASPESDELLSEPVIWLFGTEAHGLPEELLREADVRMRIPMAGSTESLNLASAAAMCMWESWRIAARNTP